MNLQLLKIGFVSLVLMLSATVSHAGVIFSFQDDGGNVTMTSSGSVDVSQLVSIGAAGWGGTGVGTFTSGNTLDMVGSTSAGSINSTYTFSAGTDTSAWNGGSFVGGSNFFGFTDSGTTQFATYAYDGSYLTGLGINTEDLIGTIWTPDNSWLAIGTSIAALGFIEGLYTIADGTTGEFITVAINTAVSVSEPSSIALFGLGLAGLGFVRRRRQQA